MSEYGIMRVPKRRPPARGTGRHWLTFAGTLLVVAGVLNIVYGFSAIYNDDYVAEEEFLYGPVSVWGWLAVGIGVVMLATAVGLFLRSGMAALIGIAIAAVSALMHVLAIGAATAWSLVIVVVDLLVIYGLASHGFDRS